MGVNIFSFLIANRDRQENEKSFNRNKQIKESLQNNKKFQKFSKKLKKKPKPS